MIKDNRQLLVLIHGWGFDTGVFEQLAEQLKREYRIQFINLPGYAGVEDVSEYSLSNISQLVAEQITEQAIIVGWSMGGLIAIEIAAKFPEKINKLILITSTPCFGKRLDWLAALDINILENFVTAYNKQPDETLNKFSYLASEGTKKPKNWIRELKKLSSRKVSQQALEQGLQLLLTTDLRGRLKEIETPTLMIFGENDSLVPVSAELDIISLNAAIKTRVVKGAGHTPFMTDTKLVAGFINEHVTG